MFIDFVEAGFKADFEPQFQIMDAEGERAIRDLRGGVICAVPPGLNSGELLLHLAHTVNDGSASLRYAPMHELNPEGIAEALKRPQEISPWFLTSIAARRMTENLLGALSETPRRSVRGRSDGGAGVTAEPALRRQSVAP